MSNFWKVFISVVVTILVVGGGIFYLMQRQINSIQDDNQAKMDDLNKQIATLKSTSSTSTTPTATTDEAANWKTYTNTTYGFVFKYPSTLTVADELNKTGNWTVAKKLKVSDSTDSLELWVNPDGFGPFFPEYTYKITAAVTGLTITSKDKESVSEGQSDSVTFAKTQFIYGKNTYLLHFKIKGSDSNPLTQFDTILSTFQFTPVK